MPLSLVLFCLFPCLFCLFHSTVAESSGLCYESRVVEKHRYAMDRKEKRWRYERYNETVERQVCCEGYRSVATSNRGEALFCVAECDPPCENSDCVAPNACVCHARHVMINNSSSSCVEMCDACVNGECRTPQDEECSCFPGYSRDPTVPHVCDPVCSPACVNATCAAPGRCECFDGFQVSDQPHVCKPSCAEDCIFGSCTAPDECSCFEGYINDMESPSICLPVCNTTCVNGDCNAPDMCKCREGFMLHPMDPYTCLPSVPEHSSLNNCVLSMPQAVKYDTSSDCFSIKDKITVSVPTECRVLERQNQIFCDRPENCHLNECVLNFRCSARNMTGSNEIHCYLEQEDFLTDSSTRDHLTTSSEWNDVVLVVNSNQYFNSSLEFIENITKEWTLHPLSKGPICGKMHFAVEMSECKVSTKASHTTDQVNSSFMFWMNVSLVCVFLLMVGVGIGGFLWARHRRLNDPLNYRGSVSHGYTNESYDNRSELVSDDESYSDAPL